MRRDFHLRSSLDILGPNTLLDSRALRNAINPFEQMRELLDLLLLKSAPLPSLDPSPL